MFFSFSPFYCCLVFWRVKAVPWDHLAQPGQVLGCTALCHCPLPVWLPLDLGTVQEQGHCSDPAGHTIAHLGATALLAHQSTHKLMFSCYCPAPPDLFPDFQLLHPKSGALYVAAVT